MNQRVELRLKEIEAALDLQDRIYGAHYPTERYLLALCKKQREALKELVELKAMKDRLKYAAHVSPEERARLTHEYSTRKPDAWPSALSALSFDPSEDASGGGG